MKNIFKVLTVLFLFINSAYSQTIVWPSDFFTAEGQMIVSNVQKQPARINAGTSGQFLIVGSNGYPSFSSNFLSSITLANNTWLQWRNAANSADIGVLRVTATNSTQLDTLSGTNINFSVNGTTEVQIGDNYIGYTGTTAALLSNGSLSITVNNDSNRQFTYESASDTSLTFKFGDSGTTASQDFRIMASTADADDDSRLDLSGGGNHADVNRGSFLTLMGNERAGSGGSVTLAAGDTVNGNLLLLTENASTNIQIGDATTTANRVTIANSGSISSPSTIRSTATADIGWVIYTGLVNATCNTQCTSACVVGMDTDGAKTTFVACSAATAENCLCAGAS